MKRCRPESRACVALVVGFWALAAQAFGPEGHRIAGGIAESYLCATAVAEVARLGAGADLGELGLWADRIRDDPRWRDSAPWHYMNIADHASLDDYRSPPQGDILWAVSQFRAELADLESGTENRAEALRFLAHFVVDLHQPLHVGRLADRGGNTIEVEIDGERVSLHRFWDSQAIAGRNLTVRRFLRSEQPLIVALAAGYRHSDERGWAAESLALRDFVYDFDVTGGRLSDEYRAVAEDLVRLRLTQAGLRLAAELNAVLCPGRAALLGP